MERVQFLLKSKIKKQFRKKCEAKGVPMSVELARFVERYLKEKG